MKRNKELLRERNEAIKKRYEQLYNTERLRHDDVIAQLEKEFYLSQRTISCILYSKGK